MITGTASYPLVSIIIPILNEARYIKMCLNAVLNQTYPSDRIEILIVDGMSTDGTREIVEGIARRSSHVSIRIFDNSERIVPIGMNIGVRHARGDIIIRVDGHSEIAPDYVKQCVLYLLEEDANVG